MNQAIPFQIPQSLGKHLLGNTTYLPLQLGKSPWSPFKQANNKNCPLVANAVKYLPRGTVAAVNVAVNLNSFHQVTTSLQSAYFPLYTESLIVTIGNYNKT
jgi:hypothetical protein